MVDEALQERVLKTRTRQSVMPLKNIVGDSHRQCCQLGIALNLCLLDFTARALMCGLVLADNHLDHQQDTLVADHLPPTPPRCLHARLVARKDLLGCEGVIQECTLVTKLAHMVDQECTALWTQVLQDVEASQALVA